MKCSSILLEAVEGDPNTKKLSFATKGTPANSPTFSPFEIFPSISLARSKALSPIKLVKALNSLVFSAFTSASSTNSTAVFLPDRTCSLISKIFVIILLQNLWNLYLIIFNIITSQLQKLSSLNTVIINFVFSPNILIFRN